MRSEGYRLMRKQCSSESNLSSVKQSIIQQTLKDEKETNHFFPLLFLPSSKQNVGGGGDNDFCYLCIRTPLQITF